MTALVWVGVMVCGGFGAVLRFAVDGEILRRTATRWPLGTLAVNLSGAFVLGVLDGATLTHDAALLLGTGIVGAYTTFSTWMFETQRLVEERRLVPAAANITVSLAAGIGCAALGLYVGGAL